MKIFVFVAFAHLRVQAVDIGSEVVNWTRWKFPRVCIVRDTNSRSHYVIVIPRTTIAVSIMRCTQAWTNRGKYIRKGGHIQFAHSILLNLLSFYLWPNSCAATVSITKSKLSSTIETLCDSQSTATQAKPLLLLDPWLFRSYLIVSKVYPFSQS